MAKFSPFKTTLWYATAPPANRGGFLGMAGLATVAWLYYLAFLMAWRWQQQPEEPGPGPREDLRGAPRL